MVFILSNLIICSTVDKRQRQIATGKNGGKWNVFTFFDKYIGFEMIDGISLTLGFTLPLVSKVSLVRLEKCVKQAGAELGQVQYKID